MKQKKLQTIATLISGANKAKAGAIAHAGALGLVVGSAALIDGALQPLILATNAHSTAKAKWAALAKTLRVNVKTAYDLAFVVRDTLKPALGRQYSTEWHGTGFEGSLKIPRAVAPLQQLMRSLQNYFATKPALEVANVATAALVGAALDAVTDAVAAVTVQTGVLKTSLTARRKKEKAMRMRLSGTVEELKREIGPLDARWEAFGFNQPGIKQRPEAPTAVKAKMFGEEDVAVEWEPAARAQHYRVWVKIVGVDSEPIAMGSPSDPKFMIASLPSKAVVEIGVSAVNNGGQSAVSEWVTLITG